jgi:hypothetical protein
MSKKINLNNLAALVAVRNHIFTVLNDKSACPKSDFQELNKIRLDLDKQFVESLKQLDTSCLFPEDDVIINKGKTRKTAK